jgi:hypothetical protein
MNKEYICKHYVAFIIGCFSVGVILAAYGNEILDRFSEKPENKEQQGSYDAWITGRKTDSVSYGSENTAIGHTPLKSNTDLFTFTSESAPESILELDAGKNQFIWSGKENLYLDDGTQLYTNDDATLSDLGATQAWTTLEHHTDNNTTVRTLEGTDVTYTDGTYYGIPYSDFEEDCTIQWDGEKMICAKETYDDLVMPFDATLTVPADTSVFADQSEEISISFDSKLMYNGSEVLTRDDVLFQKIPLSILVAVITWFVLCLTGVTVYLMIRDAQQRKRTYLLDTRRLELAELRVANEVLMKEEKRGNAL